jgi:hypothetical protein
MIELTIEDRQVNASLTAADEQMREVRGYGLLPHERREMEEEAYGLFSGPHPSLEVRYDHDIDELMGV